ncbi:DUF6268 family outer membrane beta-barrel protein [Dyadobacter sp. CY345]|uniref:DUF6268 family outer membrane beta-barrel protein n=1 Tax=Dyadobacter sp. CY345 TaxID=2909335 RepID=UPI001F2B57A1|nr:DUF6268 family outer membrane beta-barrel protein [Dyadobacter sp. CY345]MCF2446543.1 DUF6268 family outer membrane beta-barrel protein [Dyadobacter sp. CY345]
MINRYLGFVACSLTLLIGTRCLSQDLLPGLPGMGPSKWITIEHTQAPGARYRSANSETQRYTQEDIYVRAWVPVLHKPKYAIVLGPHYRTEQLEINSSGENPMHQMSNWKLRSMGVDMKSFFTLDPGAFLILASRVNKSGSLADIPLRNVPLNYSFTAVYLKKKSINKEIGFGLMLSKNQNLTVLPVFVFNYNFSPKTGVEISLPRRLSFRYNISSKDILSFKSEAVSRSYYITESNNQAGQFRKIDMDSGVMYNRQINKLVGVELFAGYRTNISNTLPAGVVPIKTSGFTAAIELYIRPPFGSSKKSK